MSLNNYEVFRSHICWKHSHGAKNNLRISGLSILIIIYGDITDIKYQIQQLILDYYYNVTQFQGN